MNSIIPDSATLFEQHVIKLRQELLSLRDGKNLEMLQRAQAAIYAATIANYCVVLFDQDNQPQLQFERWNELAALLGEASARLLAAWEQRMEQRSAPVQDNDNAWIVVLDHTGSEDVLRQINERAFFGAMPTHIGMQNGRALGWWLFREQEDAEAFMLACYTQIPDLRGGQLTISTASTVAEERQRT